MGRDHAFEPPFSADLEGADITLPSASLNLSDRIRDLRARQGLKQSEVARRMRIDPSIPSTWEKGKRLVPANRIRALAGALEVTVEELLEGVGGIKPQTVDANLASDIQHNPLDNQSPDLQSSTVPDSPQIPQSPKGGIVSLEAQPAGGRAYKKVDWSEEPFEIGYDKRIEIPRTLAVIPDQEPSLTATPSQSQVWVPASRPPLEGWIPKGWAPTDRLQDISPILPDGYWLDPIRIEKNNPKGLLRARLCDQDWILIAGKDVPGAAMAERIYQHCGKEDEWFRANLPLTELLFRRVLMADHGGLTDGALVEELRARTGAVPVTATLLRRLRDVVRPYPMARVDADLFGGRR